ncbi:cholesterol 7-desaturase nvd-like [Saccostrea echinata]|uniref:cholesterol 7-desaturase nvd-like n=1 Tax=Saccostrea echinata TaxID=191078 RepID=UPI002A7FF96F|nr:cholesterol 7-desaturase nvd-like [Saccostrea echinata]
MGDFSKCSSMGVIICVLILVVSASVTQRVLNVPLYETGRLWMSHWNSPVWNLLTDFSTIYTYVAYAVIVFVLYKLHGILFVPVNRIRYLGDLGYISDGDLKETVNRVRKQRNVGDIPPVYPNGWFALLEGFKLQPGNVQNLSVLGLNLAVFRGEDGVAHVVDAYCPHMGANLAVGGKVVGDCIQCPFHGWQFRGSDGKCTKIPYSEKVPDIAKVKSYTSTEVNGWIYLWYHAEGSEPTWSIPTIPEITRKEWVYKGRTEHYINCHIEEVPENGADVQHLQCVHTPLMTSGIDLRHMWNKLWSFGSHSWLASWEAHPPPEEHIGTMTLKHSLNLFGKQLSGLDMDVKARQIGPGIVYLTFESPVGNGAYIHHITPVEPMLQKLVHNIYVQRYMPTIVATFFMIAEAIQVERDIMIWNNKRYERKPMFVKSKEDSMVAKHRRWYSQFYSENSPRLKFQKESLDW